MVVQMNNSVLFGPWHAYILHIQYILSSISTSQTHKKGVLSEGGRGGVTQTGYWNVLPINTFSDAL